MGGVPGRRGISSVDANDDAGLGTEGALVILEVDAVRGTHGNDAGTAGFEDVAEAGALADLDEVAGGADDFAPAGEGRSHEKTARRILGGHGGGLGPGEGHEQPLAALGTVSHRMGARGTGASGFEEPIFGAALASGAFPHWVWITIPVALMYRRRLSRSASAARVTASDDRGDGRLAGRRCISAELLAGVADEYGEQASVQVQPAHGRVL